jgi:hypothetical protein
VDELIGAKQLPSIIRFQKGRQFNQDALQQILGQYDVKAEYVEKSASFSLTCSIADKQALLLALLSAEGLIAELVVNDPGLEELFLHLNSNIEIM